MNVGLPGHYQNIAAALRQTVVNMPEADRPALARIAFDNRVLDEPTETWWRISVQPSSSRLVGLSPRVYRTLGLLLANVFTPLGEGDAEAYASAERLCAAFLAIPGPSYNGQSVIVDRAYCSRGVAEDNWYNVPVTVMWRADVMHAP